MGDLALVLVELRGIGAADAVDGEVAAHASDVRDLEMADEAAAEHGDAAAVRKDVGNVGERPELRRPVVDSVARRQRIFDAEIVAKIARGGEVAEIAARALDHRAGLEPAEAAAVDADFAAVFEQSRLSLEIDDSGGAIAVLRGEGSGDELDRARDP